MASSTRARRSCRYWVVAWLLAAGTGHGEVVFTPSAIPENTPSPLSGGQMVIGPSQGVSSGNNLFHSFSVFNVRGAIGESAVFTGPNGLRNIISRVTGGTSSLIDGLVSVAVTGANFFFINPNGIIIGPNGSIHASGSVYLSTADAVRLGDGGVFYADTAKPSSLTTADPVAFGFLSNSPASIVLDRSRLGLTEELVPPGKTFALIGGDITMGGDITIPEGAGLALIVAPGATVSLASVGSAGDAILGNGAVDVSGFANLGHIRMSGAFIDVGGDPSGSIYIRGNQLDVLAAGLLAQTFGDTDAERGLIDIAVRADMNLVSDPQSGDISSILTGTGSYPDPGGLGKGAAIRLDVGGTLTIADGSFVISESYGLGEAGDIYIRAGAIDIRGLGAGGYFTGIRVDSDGPAAGASLAIDVGSLTLLNGGFVGTSNFGPGTGGALTIEADSVRAFGSIDPDTGAGAVTLSLSTETFWGSAGNLTIHTRSLELVDGARISSSTGGDGDAGNLNIVASEQVNIDGRLSGIFSMSAAGAVGNAGTLTVTTPLLRVSGGVIDSTTVSDGNAGAVSVFVDSLQLTHGGQIRSFSGGFDETNNDALVAGAGAAGNVNVVASGEVLISGGSGLRPSGLITETRGTGAGGDVQVQAMVLRISDGGTISSSSLGDGVAGNIEAHLGDSLEMSGGRIASRAVTSDGGNINIYAPRLIRLVDSQITTSVESGVGSGGNIFIDPQFMLLQNSQIIANAFGGPGGNIGLVAGQLIVDPSTIISASSALGIDGTVNIEAPDTDVSAGLAVLQASFLDAASLMRAGCSAARAGLSSLVQVGRGGLPPDPGDALPSMDLGALAYAGTGAGRGAKAMKALRVSPDSLASGLLLATSNHSDCSP